MNIQVAILVDGSFFLKRLGHFKRKFFATAPNLTPQQSVNILQKTINKHLRNGGGHHSTQYLYRVFYYDAPPLEKRAHYPIIPAGQQKPIAVNFKTAPETVFRLDFFDLLKKQRKFAIRLGEIKDDRQWKIKDNVVKRLINQEIEFADLTNNDFYYSIRQKGVDIKLGVDIANLAQNKYVNKIILIAGDSDFVPAAKFARINGLDFVLNPLRNHIDPKLNEHIDGLESFDLVGMIKKELGIEPIPKPHWWT